MAKQVKSEAKVSASSSPAPRVSAEERQRMIAEAAYFRAQQRGFAGGDSLDDWLAAERQIDQASSSAGPQKKETRAA